MIVTSYTYHIPQSKAPQFVYIEDGYDKNVLPGKVRLIVRAPRRICFDVEVVFGPAGKKFFNKHHYIGCELHTT